MVFFAIFLRRYGGRDTPFGKGFADFVAVISLVTNQRFGFGQVFQQYLGPFEVTALSFGEMHANGASMTIADRMQFGVQPTFGAANQPWLTAPFLRLEAVRWAFRCVASIIRISLVWVSEPDSSSKMRSNTPIFDHRTKRL